MRATLLIHIAAGTVGLLSGYVALYSTKGATLHRRSGMAFFYAMLVMALFGIVVAAGRGVAPALNIPAALLTMYLVVTGTTTVRPSRAGGRRLDVSAMLFACAVVLADLLFLGRSIATGGTRADLPAFPFIMFAVVGSLAVRGDLRVIRNGPLQGPRRLARHLWRMCFALFIAAMSFFLGQAKVIPKPIRIPPLLAFPVLAVLVTMIYWMRRVRARRPAAEVIAMQQHAA